MADTVNKTLGPQLDRRGFLKGCTMAAAALGLSDAMIPKLVEAAATAETACALARQSGDPELQAKNQQLLELYRSGKPCRE